MHRVCFSSERGKETSVLCLLYFICRSYMSSIIIIILVKFPDKIGFSSKILSILYSLHIFLLCLQFETIQTHVSYIKFHIYYVDVSMDIYCWCCLLFFYCCYWAFCLFNIYRDCVIFAVFHTHFCISSQYSVQILSCQHWW